MPRGQTTRLTVRLTSQERLTLHARLRSTTIPVGRARRGRIILLLAEGRPINQIAQVVGISRRFVYKWVQRFRAQGVEGLLDRPRQGPWPALGLEDAAAACPHCGETGCERSCTGALLADAEEGEA